MKDTGDVPGGGTETPSCFVWFHFLHTEYDVGFQDFNGLHPKHECVFLKKTKLAEK
ncbi:hypothetical protein KP79_PYT21412 [Mizuhopecten yessoensis]|uniref:Uncharacterized protein n=1 Tax=Mizuhopecten yessoensis TaxID=6573 RepID=A0A210PXN1_MIZYE|nr:hypothetical protein KP79_PYT21412 [Mizuhopecten yessoensis]